MLTFFLFIFFIYLYFFLYLYYFEISFSHYLKQIEAQDRVQVEENLCLNSSKFEI